MLVYNEDKNNTESSLVFVQCLERNRRGFQAMLRLCTPLRVLSQLVYCKCFVPGKRALGLHSSCTGCAAIVVGLNNASTCLSHSLKRFELIKLLACVNSLFWHPNFHLTLKSDCSVWQTPIVSIVSPRVRNVICFCIQINLNSVIKEPLLFGLCR